LHRVHTFLATSDIHLKHKLKISRDECVEKAVKAVKYASSLVEDVEFSCEDACRSDVNFLVQIIAEVIKAGAKTINVPDTVGFTTPDEYRRLIHHLKIHTHGGDKVVWSTHCHNDLGLATANTLAGILGGARQVEVTINGIGERAGNTALEEMIMAIRTRPSEFPVDTSRINTTHIMRISRMVRAIFLNQQLEWGHFELTLTTTTMYFTGELPHWHARSAEQGHRWSQRFCARGRHSPGRRPQACRDL